MTRCTTAGVSPVSGNKRREVCQISNFMLEWTVLDVECSCGCGVSENVHKQGSTVGA